MRLAIIMIAIAIATVIPTAFAAHQGVDINTLPYPKADCISGEINGVCYVAQLQLANGTMFTFSIDSSVLGDSTTQTQTQTNEEDDVSSNNSEEEEEPEDTEPADQKTGADCWENGDFIGTDECDTGGLPLCSEVESGRCFDEQDAPDVE